MWTVNWSCNWPFLITDVKQNVKPFLHFYLSKRRSSKKTKTKKGHSRKQRPFFEQQKMQFKTCSENGSWFYCKIKLWIYLYLGIVIVPFILTKIWILKTHTVFLIDLTPDNDFSKKFLLNRVWVYFCPNFFFGYIRKIFKWDRRH